MTLADPVLEQELIGNLLTSSECAIEVYGNLAAEDFADDRFAQAFQVVMDAFVAGEAVGARIVADRAGLPNELLVECMERGWLTANIKYRVKTLRELANKRHALSACRQLFAEIKQLDVVTISSRLIEIAAGMSLETDSKKVFDSEELCRLVTDIQSSRADRVESAGGPQTGFPTLDRHTGGLQSKRMTLLAAGTGFGKTTLALNVVANVAGAGYSVLHLSVENDVQDNVDRLSGIASGRKLLEIESGAAANEVKRKFQEQFLGKKLYISDNAPRTIDEICGTISRYAVQHGIQVAIVDYIGEISGDGGSKETEEARLARYGQRLVDCARRMGIHIIVLAQLNREGNAKGRPTKSDLAGCFKLAQKAHTMLLFWRDERQDVLTIEKNRQGAANVDIAVSFNRNNQRIEEQGIWVASKKEIIPCRSRS